MNADEAEELVALAASLAGSTLGVTQSRCAEQLIEAMLVLIDKKEPEVARATTIAIGRVEGKVVVLSVVPGVEVGQPAPLEVVALLPDRESVERFGEALRSASADAEREKGEQEVQGGQ